MSFTKQELLWSVRHCSRHWRPRPPKSRRRTWRSRRRTQSTGLPLKDENGSGDTTVAVAASGDQRIDGLLSGISWSDGFITYSDPDASRTTRPAIPRPFSNFQQLNAAQLRRRTRP